MRKKFFSLLVLLAAVVTSAMAQEESLLTTLTFGESETYGETTSGVVNVTATNVGSYNGTYGWLLDEGGYLSVTAKEGYTITKCVFRQNAKTPITDTEAPFEIHTNYWGGIIEDPEEEMDGVTSIEVYGYANAGGAPAEPIVVIWNSYDLPSSGSDKSFTKDGVTITCGGIEWEDLDFYNGGTFTTDLGNFTKIEVYAGWVTTPLGEGWSGNSESQTWTGNASSVSFSGEIMSAGEEVILKFTIEPASTPEPDPAKYYIVGTMNSWQVDENYEMNPSLESETEEYFYTLDLTTTSEFKVVKVQNGQQSWIPEGMGNNYGQNGEITEDAEYTVYFRPNFDGEGEDWFYSCIYAEKTGEFVPETPTYYLVGNMTEWDVDENYELNPNIDSDIEEYFYVLDLTTSSQFKVVKVQNGQQSWFPSGMDNNYGQNGEITEDGEYTVYFRPNYNGGEDWFYNCIYVSKNEPEPAEVTVVFAANNKTAERTVTLPHTFKCDWAGGMERPDELDIIIHELYNDYFYCNSNMNASGSDQVEVGTEEDPKNDYITIKGVFEGTATVTGDYLDYIAGDYGEHNYSITISIKGSEPEPTGVENVQTNPVQATKFFRDGQLLIEKNGKTYTVQGVEVR